MTAADEMLGLLIPLNENYLLLPNAAVAEVIGHREAKVMADSPDWLLGEMQWRRQTIPMISFEKAVGLAYEEPKHRARICVCNTLSEHSRLPYVGIVSKGIPRLVRVNRDNIEASEDEQADGLISNRVMVAGETALIPDLDELEKQLLETPAGLV